MKLAQQPKRAYVQRRRAEAVEATAERIVEAFATRMRDAWFDEIRLDDVAEEAGVSVQTVLRRFGSKEGLLSAVAERTEREINARRAIQAGDIARAVRVVIEDYEASGDLVMRVLAQEDRFPALRRMADLGRASHRAWVAGVFAPWLAGDDEAAARRRLDALVTATDLYQWKLIRRDMCRPLEELEALMLLFIAAALGGPTASPHVPEKETAR